MNLDGATLRNPENLLHHLGVSEAGDIDIEAVAQCCGATVVYEPLEGSEARIIGAGNRAIITVNNQSSRGRQRFSVGHELGHWIWDRGKTAFSCDSGQFAGRWTGTDKESIANKYAAELLLPRYLFKPIVAKREITFKTAKDIAKLFQTSLTATAIRLVQLGSYPSMLICSELNGRKWFFASAELERKLWPRKNLSRDSVAYSLLTTSKEPPGPTDIDADAWIDRADASQYVFREDSVKITPEIVLSLLWWKDEAQVLDLLGG